MQTAEVIKETTLKIGRSITFKLVTMFILVLVLLIPASMVKSLIRERDDRKWGVINEISQKWGQAQTVAGPVISIPYIQNVAVKNGKTTQIKKYLHLLPDSVDIKSQIIPEIRYRGIYEAVLYHTTLSLEGSFPSAVIEEMQISPDDVVWSGAFISLGITDMRGIKEPINATFDGKSVSMEPGIKTADVIPSGVSAGIRMDGSRKRHPFHFELNLNGSRQINFTPVGKVTTVTASSPWKDPSFNGGFLPIERTLDQNGFTAKWKILHLNRNYPQYWQGKGHDLFSSIFGVTLFSPVNIYQKTMRTAKYALMFIVFTFMAFFISEVMNRLRVHPVQYFLIGLALIIFYTLLLSISEQMNFEAAYLISAIAIISLITGYGHSILKNRSVTGMVGGILAILYAYLYILLQIEDYALLMGSVGLFCVLCAIMYMTRHIDWYAIHQEASNTRPVPATDPSGSQQCDASKFGR